MTKRNNSPSMKYRDRKGAVSILTVVLLFTFSLTVLAIHLGWFSQSVVKNAKLLAIGRQARGLAEGFVTNGHFYLSRAINYPSFDKRIWNTFRQETGSASFELDGPTLCHAFAELALHRDYILVRKKVEVTIDFQKSSSREAPSDCDRYGTVTLTAKVENTECGVSRTVTSTFDFILSLASTPRPFDLFTLYLDEGHELVNGRYKANALIESARLRLDELITTASKIKGDYEEIIDGLEGKDGGEKAIEIVRQALSHLNEFIKSYPGTPALAPQPNKVTAETVSLFPDGPFSCLVWQKEMDLTQLNLPFFLTKSLAELKVLRKEQRDARKALETFYRSDLKNPQALIGLTASWCVAANRLAKGNKKLLLDGFGKFQRSCVIFSGKSHALMRPSVDSLSRNDLLLRSSCYLAEGDKYGMGDLRDLSEKVSSLINRNGAFSGILFVDNKKQELVIDGTLAGRLVIVAAGPLRLTNVQRKDKDRDLLTFIALDRIVVEGKVNASVVAMKDYVLEPEAEIDGNLILRRVDMNKNDEELLRGQLFYDKSLRAGPLSFDYTTKTVDGGKQVVALSPTPIHSKVAW